MHIDSFYITKGKNIQVASLPHTNQQFGFINASDNPCAWESPHNITHEIMNEAANSSVAWIAQSIGIKIKLLLETALRHCALSYLSLI